MSSGSREKALDDYLEFLRHPSVSATGEGIAETAEYLRDLLEDMGVAARLENTGGHPVVFGEYDAGAKKTILVYNHYDVQPVDPLNEWKYPPFSPTVEDGHVYARGASDNKGTLVARLYGFKRLQEEGKLALNVKFLFEGEEEIGSPHLADYVRANAKKLAADGMLMEGSGIDSKGRPEIVLGVKGILYVEMRLSAGTRDLHSSSAPLVENPAWTTVKLLNSLMSPDGRVAISGFYDEVEAPDDDVKKMIEALASETDLEELKSSLGVQELRFSSPREALMALYTEPTCNLDGVHSGYGGPGSKTVIPHEAVAKIDFRLVPNQDPYKIFDALKAHLENRGFRGQLINMGPEYPARTSPRSPLVAALVDSANRVYGKQPLLVPNSAGTQPMWVFTKLAGIKDAVSAIGVGSPSSRAHSPNENVRVSDFYKAIDHTYEFMKAFQALPRAPLPRRTFSRNLRSVLRPRSSTPRAPLQPPAGTASAPTATPAPC